MLSRVFCHHYTAIFGRDSGCIVGGRSGVSAAALFSDVLESALLDALLCFGIVLGLAAASFWGVLQLPFFRAW